MDNLVYFWDNVVNISIRIIVFVNDDERLRKRIYLFYKVSI